MSLIREARLQIRIALPVFLAQFSQMSLSFVDTVMTGHSSAVDMAAVGVAASIWAPLSLFGCGCLMALTPLTAQFAGAGDRLAARHYLRQGLALAIFLTAGLLLCFGALSANLDSFGMEPRLQELAGGYLRAMMWGFPALMFFAATRAFIEGFSYTRPAMIFAFFGLLLNIPCNYILIYGKLGFPVMGAVGCGVASAFVMWVMATLNFLYLWKSGAFKDLAPLIRLEPIDWPILTRILRIGLPSALALLFEVSFFALSALLLSPLGTLAVAGHQIAMNFSGMLFMLPLSLCITATIRTGFTLGAQDLDAAHTAAKASLLMGTFFALGTGLLTVLFRHQVVRLYSSAPELTDLSVILLLYAGAYQLVDAIQTIAIGILRGYNDTRMIFFVCGTAYLGFGLPLGYILARTSWIVSPMGPAGFWTSFLITLSIAAFLFLTRLHFLAKKDIATITAMVRR